MYSSTGYEALYLYLGLNLQKGLRDILVSESFFQAIVLLTIGAYFSLRLLSFFQSICPVFLFIELQFLYLSSFGFLYLYF